ncbi:MAG: hypothetical protein WD004_04140 [Actinomycetota bacterium]
MARFWVSNSHEDGQCGEMMTLLGRAPEELKGTEVWCTCPSGQHEWFMIAEGNDTDSLLESLPDELRIGSTTVMKLASATL